jgi:hypothetical protein
MVLHVDLRLKRMEKNARVEKRARARCGSRCDITWAMRVKQQQQQLPRHKIMIEPEGKMLLQSSFLTKNLENSRENKQNHNQQQNNNNNNEAQHCVRISCPPRYPWRI